MINYNNGKIYKIEPICEHDEEEIYIGSTTKQYLCQRMAAHNYEYKKWKDNQRHYYTCFKLFDKYSFENCTIVLLELVNVNTKDELEMREKHYIKTHSCVNRMIPQRKAQEYQEDNKEQISLKHKKYYAENKVEILNKLKEKCCCSCGSTHRISDKARHFKTMKHQNFINKII